MTLWPWLLVVLHALLAVARAADGGAVAGAYVFGHEVRSFQPCRSSAVYWAKPASPAIARRLRAHHAELAARPYGRIYVVVIGRPVSDNPTGFAESYEGYFEISEVLEAAGSIPPECGLD